MAGLTYVGSDADSIGVRDTPAIAAQRGLPAMAFRRDSDATIGEADGDLVLLNTNAFGRLKVAAMPGDYANATGTITTATSVAGPVDVTLASNVTVWISGTFTGVNVTFEGSADGTNWSALQAMRADGTGLPITATGVLASPGAGLAHAYELSVNTLISFRVRATAWATGTANISMTRGAYATEPVVFANAREIGAPTSALTSVASAASSTSLLAANTARRGAMIFNESTAILYVALAASASVTAYTYQIPAGGYWEVPALYTGAVFGIWAAANGSARITQITA